MTLAEKMSLWLSIGSGFVPLSAGGGIPPAARVEAGQLRRRKVEACQAKIYLENRSFSVER